VNFQSEEDTYPPKSKSLCAYPASNGRLLWTRFGLRPTDSAEGAEARFHNYMANRMAWIHSLGSLWIVSGAVLSVGRCVQESVIHRIPVCTWALMLVVVLLMAVAWCWHSTIAARAEQWHFQDVRHR